MVREVQGKLVIDVSSYGIRKKPVGEAGCVMCGRPLNSAHWGMVFVDGSTDTAAALDDEASFEDDPGFMGCFPIGSECARKIRKAVRAAGLNPDQYVFRMQS